MCHDIRDGLTAYITENQERFYRTAYSHVGDREAALDIVQNAIVKGLENYGTLRKPEYMQTWFYRILLNECYGYLRKYRRELSYDPEILDRMRDGAAEEREVCDIYRQVLSLPDKMKTVILLRYYEDLSLEEIADVTGSGLGAVKYRLYAGLKKMEKQMKEGEKWAAVR